MTHGRQLKDCMLRIIRAAKVVKDKAYDLDEDAYLQMNSLVIVVAKGKAFMDSLKPQPLEEEESAQIVLDLDSTVNGTN